MEFKAFTLGISAHLSSEIAGYAIQSRVFRDWTAALRTELATVNIDAVDFRGKPSAETVMFVRLKVKTADKPFDQIVQLRGNSVGLLIVLNCEKENFTFLTKQTRLPTGDVLVELPAGMVDGGTFAGAAAKEIAEETGLTFSEADLIPLSQEPIYLSPGLLDEAMAFFAVERTVTRVEFDELIGKITGAVDEHEHITLRVVRLEEVVLAASRDAKAYIAFLLYSMHLHEKK